MKITWRGMGSAPAPGNVRQHRPVSVSAQKPHNTENIRRNINNLKRSMENFNEGADKLVRPLELLLSQFTLKR